MNEMFFILDEYKDTFSIPFNTLFIGSFLKGEELIDESIEQGIFEKDIDGDYYEDIVYEFK